MAAGQLLDRQDRVVRDQIEEGRAAGHEGASEGVHGAAALPGDGFESVPEPSLALAGATRLHLHKVEMPP